MYETSRPRNFGGGAISRQLSASHITPRFLADYQNFFRQSSSKEEGWLETQVGNKDDERREMKYGPSGTWRKCWFAFDDGILRYGPDTNWSNEHSSTIHMNRVISLKTVKFCETVILITTMEDKVYLKAPSVDEMRRWLFSFQKSVALVLLHLLEESEAVFGVGQVGIGGTMVTEECGKRIAEDQLYLGMGIGGSRKQLFDAEHYSQQNVMQSLRRRSTVFGDTDSTRQVGGGLDTEGLFVRRNTPDTIMDAQLSDWVDSSRSSTNLSRMFSVEGGRNNRNSGLDGYGGVGIPMGSSRSSSLGFLSSNVSGEVCDVEAASTQYSLAHSYLSNAKESILNDKQLDYQIQALASTYESDDDELDAADSPDAIDDPDSSMMFDLDEPQHRQCSHKAPPSLSPPSPKSSSPLQLKKHASLTLSAALGINSSGLGAQASRNGSCEGRSSHSNNINNGSAFVTTAASVRSTEHSTPRVRWTSGHCTKVGPRSGNEDRLVCLPDLIDEATFRVQHFGQGSPTGSNRRYPPQEENRPPYVPTGFFAVYDGHCGDQASSKLQRDLHIEVYKHASFHDDLRMAISETCVRYDREFLALCHEKRLHCGSTAIGAFVKGSTLLVFNIGDSHAVLCSSGKAVEMSSAHKPGRPDETARIEQARGWITEEKELYMGRLHRMDLSDPLVRGKAQQVNWVSIHRVCGELSVSRSIGDPDYKSFVPGKPVDALFLWPEGHEQCFMADLVIPDPEFAEVSLAPEDEFLIIASDGLWDVVSSIDAVEKVHESLNSGKTVSECAEELCDLALKLGSSDNVTIVIVKFQHS